MGEATREALRKLESLLGRGVNSEDIDAALRSGLEARAKEIESRRSGAATRPRKARKTPKGRHIQAAVKREVWARDGGRCTFVAGSGRRCEAHGNVEYDHIIPVARGGQSTPDNLRLRCRAHNQFEAEQMFGAGFMHEKRERGRAKTLPPAAARTTAAAAPATEPPTPDLDVTPWLRHLGFRADEAKSAAAQCAGMHGASLEARIRAALAMLAPRVRRGAPPPALHAPHASAPA